MKRYSNMSSGVSPNSATNLVAVGSGSAARSGITLELRFCNGTISWLLSTWMKCLLFWLTSADDEQVRARVDSFTPLVKPVSLHAARPVQFEREDEERDHGKDHQ
jgi:hypothetical protein